MWPSPSSSWKPAANHEGASVAHFAQGGPVGGISSIADFRDRISRYAVPDNARIAFVTEIPKTSVGKIDKKVLRQRFE